MRQNFALRANGGAASASSEISAGCNTWPARGVIDGDRKGSYWSNNGGWADSSSGSFSNDWLQVDFDAAKTIDELDIVTLQDNYANPSEPTETMTFSTYGLTAYSVSYWNGSAWINIPEASIVGNNKIWRKFTFSPITSTKIRVYPQAASDNGYSRLTEVEAWGTATAPSKTNVALRSQGAVATASSEISSGCDTWPARGANDGDRKGAYWGGTGGWADSSSGNFTNDWLQIDFSGNKTINEIDVFTLQDNYANPVEPTESTTFSTYGLTAFDVSYWNGSSWVQIPETVVTGNNKVWRKFTFSAITTSKIRVYGRAAIDNGFSRIAEVEAWSPTESTAGTGVQWLVTDQLGTPRMVLDQTGSVAGIKRHDYLPFGEELQSQQGLRTEALGYSGSDGVRQQFTSKDRDNETGLDYFVNRYYASTQGRFTSPDDFLNDTHPIDPQTWNLYGYVRNNPLRYIDPDGQIKKDKDGNIIFDKTADGTQTFKENQPLKDRNGKVIKDRDGKPLTVTISWKAENGNVFADDGTKIEAYKVTGEIQVTVKDGSGNVLSDVSTAVQDQLKAQGADNSSDCHGTTFAKGQVWINNNQVESIIKGDGYVLTSSPQAGDVGIYSRGGNLRSTVHSVLVNTVDAKGGVIDVTSKGGITPRVNTVPGPGANTAWKDPTVKLQYFTQRVGGSKR